MRTNCIILCPKAAGRHTLVTPLQFFSPINLYVMLSAQFRASLTVHLNLVVGSVKQSQSNDEPQQEQYMPFNPPYPPYPHSNRLPMQLDSQSDGMVVMLIHVKSNNILPQNVVHFSSNYLSCQCWLVPNHKCLGMVAKTYKFGGWGLLLAAPFSRDCHDV